MAAGLTVELSESSDDSRNGDSVDASDSRLEDLNQAFNDLHTTEAEDTDDNSAQQELNGGCVPFQIQEILELPHLRRRLRTQLLDLASKELRRLDLIDKNGGLVGGLNATAEILAAHSKTETKLRRLLARMLAKLSLDMWEDSDMATPVAVRLECRYLEDLNGPQMMPIFLAYILRN